MDPSNRPKPPTRPKPWTSVELDTFCQWLSTGPTAAPDWLEVVVTLMAEGLRLGEVLALYATDINPDSSNIRVERTSTRNGTTTLPKTGGRTVDFGHRSANVLAPYLSPITDDGSLETVLANAAGPYSAMTNGLVFRNAVNAFNRQHTDQLPLISLHQLRHTTGR